MVRVNDNDDDVDDVDEDEVNVEEGASAAADCTPPAEDVAVAMAAVLGVRGVSNGGELDAETSLATLTAR